MRARQMKCVESDLQELIEYDLAAWHRHVAAARQQLFCDLQPADARRVPPPDVCVLLEPGCASRNHESLVAPGVGREFVAAMAEQDKVRARKRPLETIPILFVAQGGRNEPVGASDLVVLRDDGIAIDLDRAALCFLRVERAHDRTRSGSEGRRVAVFLFRQALPNFP
jgi:hypothetical protein